jgi:hypothetical protein
MIEDARGVALVDHRRRVSGRAGSLPTASNEPADQAYSDRHHKDLRGGLVDSRFQPDQLSLVSVLHLLQDVQQSLVTQ